LDYIYIYIYMGFNTSEIIDSSLLNSPLLNWDGILNKEYFIMILYILISPFLPKHGNYKQYMTIFEQFNEFNSSCILKYVMKNL